MLSRNAHGTNAMSNKYQETDILIVALINSNMRTMVRRCIHQCILLNHFYKIVINVEVHWWISRYHLQLANNDLMDSSGRN